MHDLYVSFDAKDFRKRCSDRRLPARGDEPARRQQRLIRGDVELVCICDAAGRVAAEGALPYPPGVLWWVLG
ncbi:hypothetical protein ACNKHK_18900 [Shigella flexneri]